MLTRPVGSRRVQPGSLQIGDHDDSPKVHTLAHPAPSSDQDQLDADHQVTDTVGATGRPGRRWPCGHCLPPVSLNVVGEITSLVAPPRAIAGLWSRRERSEMRERGARIKMRNRDA